MERKTLNWEVIETYTEGFNSGTPLLKRLKVPDGWLVCSSQGGVTFIPDARWEWVPEIKKLR